MDSSSTRSVQGTQQRSASVTAWRRFLLQHHQQHRAGNLQWRREDDLGEQHELVYEDSLAPELDQVQSAEGERRQLWHQPPPTRCVSIHPVLLWGS